MQIGREALVDKVGENIAGGVLIVLIFSLISSTYHCIHSTK